MWLNSSSSCDGASSSSPPPLSALRTPYVIMLTCITTPSGTADLVVFTSVSAVLVLPLCCVVLVLGRRRGRRPGAAVGHLAFLTFNMAAADLARIAGGFLAACGALACLRPLVVFASFLMCAMFSQQLVLHILACAERHLAVVHPVAYRGLRGGRGVRIRNAGVGGVWLLSLGFTVYLLLGDVFHVLLLYTCASLWSVLVVSFCSVSVLRVLIRPGPGDGGGARNRADQSKARAFRTITAILGVLTVKFGGNAVSTVVFTWTELSVGAGCSLWLSELWFSLPCSLVLPLLYLHRRG